MDYIELDGNVMPLVVRGENSKEAMQLVLEAVADRLGCTAPEIELTSGCISLTRKGNHEHSIN